MEERAYPPQKLITRQPKRNMQPRKKDIMVYTVSNDANVKQG